ncbi:MAG: hypothetical protein F6K19_21425 [Cyanothece sp. SIO1E1]|nr:hypothetical protein [Cyanothece sp. SIO1E1]
MFDRVNSITQFMVAYGAGAYDALPSISSPTFGSAGDQDQFMWMSQMEASASYIKAEWKFSVLKDGGH